MSGDNWQAHATPQERARLKELDAAIEVLAPAYKERRKIMDRIRKRMKKDEE